MASRHAVGGVQTDAQGRRYMQMSDGSKVYISPVAFGEEAPEDTTGIFRDRPQWDQNKGEWHNPISWGNILTIATGAGLGAGALSAAGMFGGGAGAAGGGSMAAEGVAPFSALPGGISGAGTGIGTGASAGAAALPSTPIGGIGTLPAAPTSGSAFAASGGGAGASGAGSTMGKIGNWAGKIDPTMAALGALSLLGGDDGPQKRQSFAGSGRTDPKFALAKAFGGTDELLELVGQRVRNAKPVVIPELPFQIGGGLGQDPANRMIPPLGVLTGKTPKKQDY